MCQHLINRQAVREYALSSHSARVRGFSRVSKGWLDTIEAKVRTMVMTEVQQHPSVGKTLRVGGAK